MRELVTQKTIDNNSRFLVSVVMKPLCLLTILFFVFKLFHLGHWSWLGVFWPLLLMLALIALSFAIIILMALIDRLFASGKPKKGRQ